MNDIKEAAPILADTSVASSEKITVKNKRSGKSVSIGIVMVVLLLTGVAIGFFVHNNTPGKKYEKADKLFSEGKINEAIALYTELADKDNFIGCPVLASKNRHKFTPKIVEARH